MKKIIKLSTLCLLCTTLLSAEDKSFITKTTENGPITISNDNPYMFESVNGEEIIRVIENPSAAITITGSILFVCYNANGLLC